MATTTTTRRKSVPTADRWAKQVQAAFTQQAETSKKLADLMSQSPLYSSTPGLDSSKTSASKRGRKSASSSTQQS